MDKTRKCLAIALCEAAIFVIGYGITIMFPQTSPYFWFGIGILSLIAAIVVWNWPARTPGRIEIMIEDVQIWMTHPFNKEKRFEAKVKAGWEWDEVYIR